MFKELIKKLLIRYVYQDWNIAIADISEDLSPANIRWMQHSYRDRWFADPFIIGEDSGTYTILVEEYVHSLGRGRLARLTVDKKDCRLLRNETILEIPTHLSFPNPIKVNGELYIYPENSATGKTTYYRYGHELRAEGILLEESLADAVVFEHEGRYYLMATIGPECNGNHLRVYGSEKAFGPYREIQTISFGDNIARRAGNVFIHKGMTISPAQVCNNDYGEGISLQCLSISQGKLELREIKRMYPSSKEYPEGFHTYNVFGGKVVIDGYRYGSRLLHKLYFRFRTRNI